MRIDGDARAVVPRVEPMVILIGEEKIRMNRQTKALGRRMLGQPGRAGGARGKTVATEVGRTGVVIGIAVIEVGQAAVVVEQAEAIAGGRTPERMRTVHWRLRLRPLLLPVAMVKVDTKSTKVLGKSTTRALRPIMLIETLRWLLVLSRQSMRRRGSHLRLHPIEAVAKGGIKVLGARVVTVLRPIMRPRKKILQVAQTGGNMRRILM